MVLNTGPSHIPVQSTTSPSARANSSEVISVDHSGKGGVRNMQPWGDRHACLLKALSRALVSCITHQEWPGTLVLPFRRSLAKGTSDELIGMSKCH